MSIVLAVLPYLIAASLAAVVVTLIAGIGGMAKGGDFNKNNGNRLMRMRVGFQALTIVLFLAYLLLARA